MHKLTECAYKTHVGKTAGPKKEQRSLEPWGAALCYRRTGRWYDIGEPCGTGPNLDCTSFKVERQPKTRAMRSCDSSWRSFSSYAMMSGSGSGPIKTHVT
ncbi:hypothetical protein ILYODFUR_038859 [Ilyodon furcidens]|uniref:Uncharacterized protein n=1 Tax=Ilyodon furcidens TaxID=33524 RepID=A0ABV0VND3_9TELE